MANMFGIVELEKLLETVNIRLEIGFFTHGSSFFYANDGNIYPLQFEVSDEEEYCFDGLTVESFISTCYKIADFWNKEKKYELWAVYISVAKMVEQANELKMQIESNRKKNG